MSKRKAPVLSCNSNLSAGTIRSIVPQVLELIDGADLTKEPYRTNLVMRIMAVVQTALNQEKVDTK